MESVYERWLWKCHKSHPYPQMEWCTNGNLQLQRLAHEGMGVGPWMACDKEIPIAKQDTMLATLNLDDLKMPRLNRTDSSKVPVVTDENKDQDNKTWPDREGES